MRTTIIVAGLLTLVLASCSKRPSLPALSPADRASIVNDNIAFRAEQEVSFKEDENSPFNRDTSISFHGLRWFPVDPRYRVHSVLHRYDTPETVVVMGTKGEERKQLKYGYFECVLPDEQGHPKALRLNVYKFTPYDAKRYALYKDILSVWFTDETTGKTTYDVGRYVEIGNENPDPAYEYTIDFNKAYNPYCAYSNLYSCAIPRKEDHLDLALAVGEMKYHE